MLDALDPYIMKGGELVTYLDVILLQSLTPVSQSWTDKQAKFRELSSSSRLWTMDFTLLHHEQTLLLTNPQTFETRF